MINMTSFLLHLLLASIFFLNQMNCIIMNQVTLQLDSSIAKMRLFSHVDHIRTDWWSQARISIFLAGYMLNRAKKQLNVLLYDRSCSGLLVLCACSTLVCCYNGLGFFGELRAPVIQSSINACCGQRGVHPRSMFLPWGQPVLLGGRTGTKRTV